MYCVCRDMYLAQDSMYIDILAYTLLFLGNFLAYLQAGIDQYVSFHTEPGCQLSKDTGSY